MHKWFFGLLFFLGGWGGWGGGYFFVPCRKFRSTYLGKTAATREALPSPISVCSIFASKQWYGWQCLGILTCAQMLLHAVEHGGCMDTVTESALKVDSGRKIPCCTGDSNRHQDCAWHFSRMLYQLSYPCPNYYALLHWWGGRGLGGRGSMQSPQREILKIKPNQINVQVSCIT